MPAILHPSRCLGPFPFAGPPELKAGLRACLIQGGRQPTFNSPGAPYPRDGTMCLASTCIQDPTGHPGSQSKRRHGASDPIPPTERRPPVLEPPPSYARVCVLGREYTTLKWFLGRKTNDAQLAKAVQYGFTRAIELSGGDSKTLQKREMVSETAARPPELLPSRQNLLSDWVETICPSLRTKGRDFLWVRRVAKPSHFRHLLLPCDELVQCFQQKGGEFTKHFSRACIPNREKGAPTL